MMVFGRRFQVVLWYVEFRSTPTLSARRRCCCCSFHLGWLLTAEYDGLWLEYPGRPICRPYHREEPVVHIGVSCGRLVVPYNRVMKIYNRIYYVGRRYLNCLSNDT